MTSSILYMFVIQPFATCADGYIRVPGAEQKKCAESDCNSVNKTNVGMFFSGPNTVELQGNRFNNHKTGLYLDGTASLGIQQDHNGNRWLSNANPNSRPDAVNDNPGSYATSAFWIDGGGFPYDPDLVPNTVAIYPVWIQPNISGTNFNCNNPQVICGVQLSPLLAGPNPNINARDVSLANNTFTTTTHTAVAKYEGKRQLFKKLRTNPNLVQADPSLLPFVPNNQSTCIGHFDNVQQQCEQAFSLTSTDSIVLDSFKNTCTCYLDSLHCLDSILCINYNTITQNQRSSVANQLSVLTQQQQVFLANLEASRQSDLVIAKATNSSFITTVLHEQLEKQVNEIYLSTLALGIAGFTASQITELQFIAAYCPQEGGAAVHQARGMLSMIQDVNLLDFNCNKGARLRKDNSNLEETKWKIQLYPNPTSKLINIQSNILFTTKTKIEIYNSLGQLVQNHHIDKETLLTSIDIDELASGVYFVRIKNGEQEETQPFIISKS